MMVNSIVIPLEHEEQAAFVQYAAYYLYFCSHVSHYAFRGFWAGISLPILPVIKSST